MIRLGSQNSYELVERVERIVRDVVIPFEHDPRRDHNDCPTDELVTELRETAGAAGVLTPHILADGSHLSQAHTALVLSKTGLSPLGPLACTTQRPVKATCTFSARSVHPQSRSAS